MCSIFLIFFFFFFNDTATTEIYTLSLHDALPISASPYTDQARLLAARLYVLGGELDRAAGELAAVAENSKDRDLALVARLRLARGPIAQGKTAGPLATLNPAQPGALAAQYHQGRRDGY